MDRLINKEAKMTVCLLTDDLMASIIYKIMHPAEKEITNLEESNRIQQVKNRTNKK